MDPETLGPLLETHQLKLASGWFSGTLRSCSVEEVAKPAGNASYLQIPWSACAGLCRDQWKCSIPERVPVSQRPVMPDSEFPEYGRKLTEVADRMNYGVRMVYHHHMGTVIETEREVDLLMEHTGPSVELLIDTGI